MQSINETQKTVLKDIAHGNQVDMSTFNKGTATALVRRGLVRLITNKKGDFIKITVKGKKELN